MADAGAVARGAVRGASASFRLLNLEQKVAAVAALLLIASTFGPFSFIEAAEILTALGVLALLLARTNGKRFHLPFGDGTAIAAAGVWAGLLIIVRLFDRPLGQNLLALACAVILALAGAAERAKRPADDLPRARRPRTRAPDGDAWIATEPPPPRQSAPNGEDVSEPQRVRQPARGGEAPRASEPPAPSSSRAAAGDQLSLEDTLEAPGEASPAPEDAGPAERPQPDAD